MSYSGRFRRRIRAGHRLLTAAGQRSVWRGGIVVPAFWWDGHPNFGDDMTPWLLPHYGVVPVYRSPRTARMAAVGSILEFLPESFAGAIWGSGLMEDRAHTLSHATVLAVRGPLTRERIGTSGDVSLGDPGILVGRHARRPRIRWEVGIVAHGHHRGHGGLLRLAALGGPRVRIINVHQGAAAAARQIAACSVVLTSSLHGLVTADSYGIPAVWTRLEPELTGGDFKFRDYEAVITPRTSRFIPFDETLTPERVVLAGRRADAGVVAAVSLGLEQALGRLSAVLGALPPFPCGVVSVLRGEALHLRTPVVDVDDDKAAV